MGARRSLMALLWIVTARTRGPKQSRASAANLRLPRDLWSLAMTKSFIDMPPGHEAWMGTRVRADVSG
jgi:hypothetical protein